MAFFWLILTTVNISIYLLPESDLDLIKGVEGLC